MKLGLITDIHNDAVQSRLALKALRIAKVDQIIIIGDTFDPYDVAELWDYTGEHLDYLARSQRALADQRYSRQFVGHYHQWLAFDSGG